MKKTWLVVTISLILILFLPILVKAGPNEFYLQSGDRVYVGGNSIELIATEGANAYILVIGWDFPRNQCNVQYFPQGVERGVNNIVINVLEVNDMPGFEFDRATLRIREIFGGSSPLYLKSSQQVSIGQSPKDNSWIVLIVAIIALMLIFFTYRNFSAYKINRDRMNTKRRR